MSRPPVPDVLELVKLSTADALESPGATLAGLIPSFITGSVVLAATFGGGTAAWSYWLLGMAYDSEEELMLVVAFLAAAFVPLIISLTLMSVPLLGLLRVAWHEHVMGDPWTLGSAVRHMAGNTVAFVLVYTTVCALWSLSPYTCMMALFPALALDLAPIAVAIHGTPPLEAMSLSARHLWRHPGWRIRLWLVNLVMVVLSLVPVVGLVAVWALYPRIYVRAYGAWFGWGPAPVPMMIETTSTAEQRGA